MKEAEEILPPFHHSDEGAKKQEVESHRSLSYTFHILIETAKQYDDQELLPITILLFQQL